MEPPNRRKKLRLRPSQHKKKSIRKSEAPFLIEHLGECLPVIISKDFDYV